MNTEPTNANTIKAEIAAKRERDMKVRAYEMEKAKAGSQSMLSADTLMDETKDSAAAAGNNASAANVSTVSSDELNNLWQRVRYFLNGKDELGNDVEHTAGGRKRFTELCETKGSL